MESRKEQELLTQLRFLTVPESEGDGKRSSKLTRWLHALILIAMH